MSAFVKHVYSTFVIDRQQNNINTYTHKISFTVSISIYSTHFFGTLFCFNGYNILTWIFFSLPVDDGWFFSDTKRGICFQNRIQYLEARFSCYMWFITSQRDLFEITMFVTSSGKNSVLPTRNKLKYKTKTSSIYKLHTWHIFCRTISRYR